jgi:hypothetical protein
LGSSRVSIVYGIDGKLRGVPVKSALKLRSTQLAAGQCHSFEHPLVPKRWFLILLFRRSEPLVCIFFLRVPVLFSHKNDLNPHIGLRTRYAQNAPLLSPSVQQESDSADSMAGTRKKASRAPFGAGRKKNEEFPGSHRQRICRCVFTLTRAGMEARIRSILKSNKETTV